MTHFKLFSSFCIITAMLSSTALLALTPPAKVAAGAWFHKKGNVWVLDKAGHRQVWYKNGITKATGKFVNRRREGSWKFYYPNGSKKAAGNFVAGVRQGDWEFYYKSGKTKMKGPYVSGLRSGLWLNYYKNGKMFYKGNYKYNKQNGEWSYFFQKGQLHQKGHFLKGVRYGNWRICVQPAGPCGTERYSHARSPRRSMLSLKIKKKKHSTKNPAALLDSMDSGHVPDRTPSSLSKKSPWRNP